MKEIIFEDFFTLLKDKEFQFNGIPLNFHSTKYAKVKIDWLSEEKEPSFMITNLESKFKMCYRKSTTKIKFDDKNDLYEMVSNERKILIKL